MLHTFFIIHFGCNQPVFKPIFRGTSFSVKYYLILVYCSFISIFQWKNADLILYKQAVSQKMNRTQENMLKMFIKL